MNKNLSWVLLHSILIVTTVVSLLSGLRIATLSHPELLWFSALLPQGLMHSWHLVSAAVFTSIAFFYLLYLILLNPRRIKPTSASFNRRYHRLITWIGYTALSLLLITGLGLYFHLIDPSIAKTLHFYAALLLVIYLFLHATVYIIQYGIRIFVTIFSFSRENLPKHLAFCLAMFCVIGSSYYFFTARNFHPLEVAHIAIDEFIEIDGTANEVAWEKAETILIPTFGGANFINGATPIKVKAVENGEEMFFHISWYDPSQSLQHLPLVKTEQGWKVTQDGFHHFNERTHYEDKLAVILSNTCAFGAAGTAHLGHKPLKDKPAHWAGKGYHYTQPGKLVDLWHWKAVRTNDMFLADDNFIGAPEIERPASRRYTGGYMPDGKDSGSYVMNWKWYKQDIIIPKRLPKDPDALKNYQDSAKHGSLSWVIPWFSYEPYAAENDRFPVGTIMPSVMYTSNRFEGDRADVRARAQWSDNVWSLELVRKINTQSPKDIPLHDGVCLWIAAFDHAQIEHTRHVRPVKLVLEQ